MVYLFYLSLSVYIMGHRAQGRHPYARRQHPLPGPASIALVTGREARSNQVVNIAKLYIDLRLRAGKGFCLHGSSQADALVCHLRDKMNNKWLKIRQCGVTSCCSHWALGMWGEVHRISGPMRGHTTGAILSVATLSEVVA